MAPSQVRLHQSSQQKLRINLSLLTDRTCAGDPHQFSQAGPLVFYSGFVSRVSSFLAYPLGYPGDNHCAACLRHDDWDEEEINSEKTIERLEQQMSRREENHIHHLNPLDPSPFQVPIQFNPTSSNRPQSDSAYHTQREQGHG